MMLTDGVSGGSTALPVTVEKTKSENCNVSLFRHTVKKSTYSKLGKRKTVSLYRVTQYSQDAGA
jgi:hypothetical protein